MPRGEPLSSLLIDEEAGKRVNRKKIDAVAEERVAHVMKNEALAGIGIANDGEQGRVGFQTYVPQRMSGFGGVSSRPYGREFIEFPKFTEHMMERSAWSSGLMGFPCLRRGNLSPVVSFRWFEYRAPCIPGVYRLL